MINRFLIFILILNGSFSLEEFIDGVVAKVGENTIVNSDVLQTIQMQAMQMGVDLSKNSFFVDENYSQALDFLINQHVIYEIAKKDTLVEVSGDEISSTLENEISAMILRAGGKPALEKILGLSIQEYKMDMWVDVEKRLLIERFQQNYMSKINIARPEVVAFYNTYKDSIPSLPKRSSFSIIEFPVQPSKKAEENTIILLSSIRDSILLLDNFDIFAQKYSQDPGSKDNGGDLGYILRGNLVKEFEESAFSLSPGQISDPIKTDFGFHLIQTIDKQGEKVHARHILIQTKPTLEDKSNAEKELRYIYQQSLNNSEYFDSLAYRYQAEYQNQSGVFGLTPDRDIPPKILDILQTHKGAPVLLYPEKSGHNSYYMVFIKERKAESRPTLENSWQALETMAKNNKISKQFEMWINSEKKDLFIQLF